MKKSNWIIRRFTEYGKTPFLIFNDTHYTYADLVENIHDWTQKLRQFKVKTGDTVAIISNYTPNSICLFLALILNRNILVPLSQETRKKRAKFFETAEVNGCFKFDESDNWTYEQVSDTRRHPLLVDLNAADESGIVIFSSGTTGESKAAVHQSSKLLKKFKTQKGKAYRALIFLKLDHIGGVNTLFSIIFNGGTLVTCENRRPAAISAAIERYAVQLLPTTPTFINMLLMSSTYEAYDLSSLQVITYGTEPMPESTLRGIHSLLPAVKLKQTYGLTEMGIFSTQSLDSHSNWMKIGGRGAEVKVVDGTLWVRTETAMLGYLNAPSPFDAEGWYNTGDQVEVHGEYLKILGRKEDVINVGGEKVFPAEVESILLKMPNIKEVVVAKKKNPVTGQIVTAVVNTEKPEIASELKMRMIDFCKGQLERYKIPALITITSESLVGSRFKKMRSFAVSEVTK